VRRVKLDRRKKYFVSSAAQEGRLFVFKAGFLRLNFWSCFRMCFCFFGGIVFGTERFEYIAYAYMTPEGNHGGLPLRAGRIAAFWKFLKFWPHPYASISLVNCQRQVILVQTIYVCASCACVCGLLGTP
jgi:hypothetical protein